MKIKLSKNFNGDHLDLGNGIVLFQGRDEIIDAIENLEITKALNDGFIENVELCANDEESTEDKTCLPVKEGNEVWILAECRNGKIQKVTYEILSVANELKKNLGVKLGAVLLTEDRKNLAEELFSYGVDKVYLTENIMVKEYQTGSYTKVIASLVKKANPSIFLIGATSIGRDLAPRLAKKIGTGLTADCTSLTLDKNGLLEMTKPAYGGNLMATIKCPKHKPQMATIRPGVMSHIEPNTDLKGIIVNVKIDINESDIGTKLVEFVRQQKKSLNLDKADIIISGGRGLGCKENFDKVKILANLIGAEVGTTRAAVDEGWVDHDRMIGQTGKNVRPKLYMACGISGAIQHRSGIEKSDIIIAINKDPNAEIFQVADYGVVGDINQIIPEMIKALEKNE